MKNVVRLFILVALAASCSLDFGSLQGGIPDSGTAGAGGQAGTSASTAGAGGSTGGAGNVGPFGGTTTGGTTASSVPTAGKPSYDAAPPSVPDAPPVDPNETFTCPPGTVRIHVRDIWSSAVTPTMGTMTTAPLSVLIINPTGSWPSYGARQDTGNCSWYSVCAPNTLTKFEIKPVGADGIGGTSNSSGTFDASSLIPSKNEIWLDYTGPSSTVDADYETAAVGTQHFRLTSDETTLGTEACPQGQPDQTVPVTGGAGGQVATSSSTIVDAGTMGGSGGIATSTPAGGTTSISTGGTTAVGTGGTTTPVGGTTTASSGGTTTLTGGNPGTGGTTGAGGTTSAGGTVTGGVVTGGTSTGGATTGGGCGNACSSGQHCSGGVCVCDGTSCSGSCCNSMCVNKQTDNNNCGGCFIACATNWPSVAACTAGRCLVSLTPGEISAGRIAVDATSVYYMDGGVMKAPIGGGSPTILASGQNLSGYIAVDATTVYWTSTGGGTVMKLPTGGGTPTPVAANQKSPWGIAIDATSVYWTNYGTNANSNMDGAVMKAPIGGGATVTLAANQNAPAPIVVDATSVYWTTFAGTVMKVPIGGGTPTALASGQNEPGAIALDAAFVYWINYAGGMGTVMKVPIGGGTPTTLASGQNAPGYSIAVDTTSVYWTNLGTGADDGAVMKVPIGGGTPTTLAAGQNEPNSIAVDATSVYWTDSVNSGPVLSGAVMKLTPK